MVRIQKQLVVLEDMEFGYGKVIQKRTVDDMIVDREYDRINAENIPAKNPIGSETNIQTELDSKLDTDIGDFRYALRNGNETETFKVATPQNDNEAVPLSKLNSDLGAHISDNANPHNVTQAQVGLANVDNTSDADKPISDATQLALDDKAPVSHISDLANPHSVTASQVGADPVGSASAVQDNLDTHEAGREEHGLTTLGDGTNYLSDDGTYKNIDPITVHNQLTGRDGNDTHPIESITGLRTELDGKATAGESYLKTEHIVASTGISDAGKPIILNGAGQLDSSLLGQGLYFVAMYTPDAASEYPDDTGESTGAFWGVEGVDASSGYTFTGGDLQGSTVYNGDMVVRGEQEWGYRNFGNVGGLYLRLDGSNSMLGNLPMGSHKIVNLSPATANGEAVEYSQIAGLTTSYLKLDGSTPMTGNLDIGGGVNKIVNLVEDAVNAADVPNYGQLQAHVNNVSNPHQVTAAQVGAEPSDPDLQAHLVRTDNPHGVTATQINAEPADPAIQTHLDDTSNPHSVTLNQIGAEASLGLGTAGQILATNSAADGKEWIDKPSTGHAIVDFGTVTNDQRVVIANPFFDGVNDEAIAARCWVRAEVEHEGIWSEAGWVFDGASGKASGLKGFSNAEGIVVQVGRDYIIQESKLNGGGHDSDMTDVISAPCRVIVFYAG